MEVKEIHLLMVDYLAGRADKEDVEKLEHWVGQSKENEDEFDKVKAIWEAANYPMQETEIARALAKTKNKLVLLEEQANTPKVVKLKPLKWLRNIAAILALCFVSYFIYWRSIQEVYLTKTTFDSIDSVLLSDGSKIYLSSNTRFSYPEKIKGKTRQVALLNGEAFFKIAKDPSRPFTVTLNNSKVTVLGTSFNIRNTPRSVDLSVNSGKVAFETVSGNEKTILTVGMGLNYNVSTNNIVRSSSINQNNAYWLNRELVFVNASLNEVFESLENCYGVKIKARTAIKSKHKFNAEFKNTSLGEVLEVLKVTYPINLTLVDKKQIIVDNK